jgi:hypothetical protein
MCGIFIFAFIIASPLIARPVAAAFSTRDEIVGEYKRNIAVLEGNAGNLGQVPGAGQYMRISQDAFGQMSGAQKAGVIRSIAAGLTFDSVRKSYIQEISQNNKTKEKKITSPPGLETELEELYTMNDGRNNWELAIGERNSGYITRVMYFGKNDDRRTIDLVIESDNSMFIYKIGITVNDDVFGDFYDYYYNQMRN